MIEDVDTRITNRIAEVKAAVAVLDDARCGLVDMLEEGPIFPPGILLGLDANRDAVNAYAVKLADVAANLERIRLQLAQEKSA